MSRKVVTVAPNDGLGQAHQVMLWSGIRHLPVVDGKKLVGIVSQRDLLQFRASSGTMDPAAKVADAMSTPVETATPEDDLDAVAKIMADKGIGAVVVMAETGVKGILTTTDLLGDTRHLPDHGGVDAKVEGVMTEESLMTTEPEALLADAVSRMLEEGVRHLPVVDGGRVVGMLSDRDVRETIGNPMDAMRRNFDETLVMDVMSPEPLTVRASDPLGDAVTIFARERVGMIPVVDSTDQLVGVLSYVDALWHLAEAGGLVKK